MKKCGLFVVVTIVIGIISFLSSLCGGCIGYCLVNTEEGREKFEDRFNKSGLHFIGSNKKTSTTNEIGFKAY